MLETDCGGRGGALNRTQPNKALMQSIQHLADLSPAITAYQAKKEPRERAGLSLGRETSLDENYHLVALFAGQPPLGWFVGSQAAAPFKCTFLGRCRELA